MSFFNKFINNIVSDIKPSNIYTHSDLIDRGVEKIAESINDDIGDKIRKTHNTFKSIGNSLEAVITYKYCWSLFDEEPEIGDHIYVNRVIYTHHGIYIGDGQVIHYTGTPDNIEDATIQEDSIETFLDGGKLMIQYHEFPKYKGIDVVYRAKSRLGEQDYNLFNNNCQNFAEWCINGGY